MFIELKGKARVIYKAWMDYYASEIITITAEKRTHTFLMTLDNVYPT